MRFHGFMELSGAADKQAGNPRDLKSNSMLHLLLLSFLCMGYNINTIKSLVLYFLLPWVGSSRPGPFILLLHYYLLVQNSQVIQFMYIHVIKSSFHPSSLVDLSSSPIVLTNLSYGRCLLTSSRFPPVCPPRQAQGAEQQLPQLIA